MNYLFYMADVLWISGWNFSLMTENIPQLGLRAMEYQ